MLLLFSLPTGGVCYSMRPPTARQLYKSVRVRVRVRVRVSLTP